VTSKCRGVAGRLCPVLPWDRTGVCLWRSHGLRWTNWCSARTEDPRARWRGEVEEMSEALTAKREEILEFISESLKERGYPPSVREIGEAVGLASSSTVHAHLAVLQRQGYLRRDPTKPRAIEVRYDPNTKLTIAARPVRQVPLVGDVAAGTGVIATENVEELLPLPEDFTGTGSLFMLRVRGDSMIEAGILDGDFVVVRQQADAENGEIVVAGVGDEEATVKTFARRRGKVVLTPANPALSPMELDPSEVRVYGRVVTVLRRL
jgi:repressor LexA